MKKIIVHLLLFLSVPLYCGISSPVVQILPKLKTTLKTACNLGTYVRFYKQCWNTNRFMTGAGTAVIFTGAYFGLNWLNKKIKIYNLSKEFDALLKRNKIDLYSPLLQDYNSKIITTAPHDITQKYLKKLTELILNNQPIPDKETRFENLKTLLMDYVRPKFSKHIEESLKSNNNDIKIDQKIFDQVVTDKINQLNGMSFLIGAKSGRSNSCALFFAYVDRELKNIPGEGSDYLDQIEKSVFKYNELLKKKSE